MKEEAKQELNLKEIILLVKGYLQEVWHKKWWLLAGGSMLAVLLGFLESRIPIKYTAPMTFMVNDDQEGPSVGMGAVLGQFGLGGGGGGGNGVNFNKLLEIAQSHKILTMVLEDTATIDGKHDFIGNHLIENLELREAWDESLVYNGFRFGVGTPRDVVYNRACKFLIGQLKGNPKDVKVPRYLKIAVDDLTSILSIHGIANNEELSIALANSFYSILSKFYVDKSIERQLATFTALDERADSIYGLLTGKEAQSASLSDKQGLISNIDLLPRGRNARDINLYSGMYLATIKNREQAAFILDSETPFFQIIDEPIKPLSSNGHALFKQAIIGFLLGVFLVVLFVIARKLVVEKIDELEL